MCRTRSASVAGSAALLIAFLASTSAAQEQWGRRAPHIRVYSQSGPIASNYVTPAIQVSEDAYVFAVSFDLDGQIQVLEPATPGISVRMLRDKELRLPNFFGGYSQNEYDGSGRYVSSSGYVGDYDSRGSVIALASRTPFNLARVESDGDWNISAIRRLVEHRAPAAAAEALAAYLGARGEPIGMDYMRFAPTQYQNSYSSGPVYSCELYNGGNRGGLALRRVAVLNRVAQMQQGGRSVRVVGYDFCGMPIVAYGSSQPNTRYRPRAPEDPADTNVTKGHVRPPRSGQSERSFPRAPLGTFPLTGGTQTEEMGDVLIAPLPRQTRRDPREIFADPRIEGRPIRSAELNGAHGERSDQHRAETSVIGTLPAREYSRPIMRQAPVIQAPRPVSAPAPAPSPSKH
jgi:hypothetical protein